MRWRLIVDPSPASGPENMALDEALLDASSEPSALPSVRFYHFDAPTLTFGYRQRLAEACNEAACQSLGIVCVRRITGGRALLHQHELTYSVVSRAVGPFENRSVRGVYDLLNAVLRSALSAVGVDLDAAEGIAKGPEPPPHLPCLAVPTAHEITSGGRKVVASAQRRRRAGFLQHGAILKRLDRDLWNRVRSERASAVLDAVGLDELSSSPVSEPQLLDALVEAFTALFGGSPAARGVHPDARSRAERLVSKYASRDWTSSGGLARERSPHSGSVRSGLC